MLTHGSKRQRERQAVDEGSSRQRMVHQHAAMMVPWRIADHTSIGATCCRPMPNAAIASARQRRMTTQRERSHALSPMHIRCQASLRRFSLHHLRAASIHQSSVPAVVFARSRARAAAALAAALAMTRKAAGFAPFTRNTGAAAGDGEGGDAPPRTCFGLTSEAILEVQRPGYGRVQKCPYSRFSS